MNQLTIGELAYAYRIVKPTITESVSAKQREMFDRLEAILHAQVMGITHNRIVPVDDIP